MASNGLLVPFFDTDQLSAHVIEALTYPRRFDAIRTQARETILDRYDLSACLFAENAGVCCKKRCEALASAIGVCL